MDQHSQQINKDGGATSGDTDTPASYALTSLLQPLPLETVPPSSAAFLPVPASQGAVPYPATFPPFSNQQPSLTSLFEAVTNDAAYALTAYNHQPEALATLPPPSSAGATFFPAPASQGVHTTATYQAAIPPPVSNQHHAAFQKLQQEQYQQLQYQQQQLQAFWVRQMAEAEQTTELKVHNLPLARIKRIMKADEDVKMIAAEVPVVFAKACEMFILELTLRAWLHTEDTKRRTMQRSDVSAAIIANEMFDFLMDVAPTEERNGDGVLPPMPPPPPQQQMPTTAPVPFPIPAPFPMYANQQPSFMWPTPEYQQQQQNPDAGQDE